MAKNGEKMKKILAYVAKKCYLCGLNENTGVYVWARGVKRLNG